MPCIDGTQAAGEELMGGLVRDLLDIVVAVVTILVLLLLISPRDNH